MEIVSFQWFVVQPIFLKRTLCNIFKNKNGRVFRECTVCEDLSWASRGLECKVRDKHQNVVGAKRQALTSFSGVNSLVDAKCQVFTFFHHHHQSLYREGRWGTTDDFTTSFLHFSLFSTALWNVANSKPVNSLMLSSNLFFCLSCLLPPFTVPCKVVLARHDGRETCPFHCSLRLFTMVRRSSCGPVACWILTRTSSW